MGAIRRIKRLQVGRVNKDEKELAEDLAKEAVLLHEEGIQFAADVLTKAVEDVGKHAYEDVIIDFRPCPAAQGHGTIVSLREDTEDGPCYHQEILVATKPDVIEATDNAIATTVGFTTKALTFIPDDDPDEGTGEPIGFVIWQGSTNKAVGIQTAFSTHF